MIAAFKEHISTLNVFSGSSKVLLACSGGLDSVVLVHLCNAIGLNFSIAHCNFKLRGEESLADAEFVKNLAAKMECPFYLKSFDLTKTQEKGSIQMKARELRYEWFAQVLKEKGYEFVLTAHHLDDSLETFLINLSRGTGIKGLTGIPAQKDHVLRLLLPFAKQEIKTYAEENKLKWREDSSNLKTDYLRNQIRHRIVPELKKLNTTFLENFDKTLIQLGKSQSLLNRYKNELEQRLFTKKENVVAINLNKLKNENPDDALLYLLFSDYGFTEWGNVSQLLDAQSGKEVRSATHRLVKNRDSLLLSVLATGDQKEYKIEEGTTKIHEPFELLLQRVERFGEINAKTIYVDANKLKFPLTLRKWKQGDRFQPFGMAGKKKVSKYLKDEKIDMISKASIWVLCSEGQIVWLIGHRADERFKVTENTSQILKLALGF